MHSSASVTRRQFVLGSVSLAVGARNLSAIEPHSRRDVTWLANVQQRPDHLPKDAPQLEPIVTDGMTLKEWNVRREEIREWWLKLLNPFPVAPAPVPPLKVVAEEKVKGVSRQLVRYEVEPGLETEAYLLRPTKATGKLPAVVVFHSTVNHSIRQPAGVEGRAEKAFGLKMAQRGYVAFCPRNFLWPTNHKIQATEETNRFKRRHPRSTGMAKMLHDAEVAVDIVSSLPEVDPTRIGAIGHSLGAKEVLYLAAFDPRVKVTISSEGGIGTRFSNWNAPWYLGPEIDKTSFNREHDELLALIAPRPFLLIGGDSADGDRSWPFIEATLPAYHLFEKPARLGLFNHKQGHSVPPLAESRIYDWLTIYL